MYCSNWCQSFLFPSPTVFIFPPWSCICHKNYNDSIEMKLEQIGWLILFVHSKIRFQNSLICDSGVLKCCLSLVWWMTISQRLFVQQSLGKSSYELTKGSCDGALWFIGLGIHSLLCNTLLRRSFLVAEMHLKCEVDENISCLIPHICSVIKKNHMQGWEAHTHHRIVHW